MKYITVPIFILVSAVTYAQPGQEVWLNYYGTERSCLRDVYICENGDYIAAGGSGVNRQQWEVGFVVRTDTDGRRLWQVFHDLFNDRQTECLSTIIEADNGDIVAGGSAGNQFIGARMTRDGALIWARIYGDQRTGWCTSVIETKAGGLLFGGSMAGDQAVVMTDNDGNVDWLQTYDGGNAQEVIQSMREAAGEGYFLAGSFGEDFTTLTKINGPGEPLFRKAYRDEERTIGCEFLFSVDNRFYLAGNASGHNGNEYALLLLDHDGNEVWRRFHASRDLGAVLGACKTIENGVNFVGQSSEQTAFCFAVDHSGDSLNYQRYDVGLFWSVVTDRDGFSVACGSFTRPAYICKMNPVESPPVIVSKIPPSDNYTILTGDTVNFSVQALDYQADPINYRWTLNQDTLQADESLEIIFRDAGVDTVKCVISDTELGDSTSWKITVSDLFITAFTPDSLDLTIRRGRSVMFSIDTVAVAGGGEVNYAWTLTNLNTFESVDAGGDAGVTVDFLRSGNFQLEALAYSGESSDNVIWTIQVRSAILDFWPRSLSLSVLPDSSGTFGVLPFNPESDSLTYLWQLDGDSVGCDSTITLRFPGSQAGRLTYAVSAIVMDGAEGDTVTWTVSVREPDEVRKFESSKVEKYELLSAYPNPFNSSTTIRFSVPSSSSSSSLTLHDLSGRQVRECVRAELRAGEHTYILNGEDLPAGIYLIKLNVGSSSSVKKLVLLR